MALNKKTYCTCGFEMKPTGMEYRDGSDFLLYEYKCNKCDTVIVNHNPPNEERKE